MSEIEGGRRPDVDEGCVYCSGSEEQKVAKRKECNTWKIVN